MTTLNIFLLASAMLGIGMFVGTVIASFNQDDALGWAFIVLVGTGLIKLGTVLATL